MDEKDREVLADFFTAIGLACLTLAGEFDSILDPTDNTDPPTPTPIDPINHGSFFDREVKGKRLVQNVNCDLRGEPKRLPLWQRTKQNESGGWKVKRIEGEWIDEGMKFWVYAPFVQLDGQAGLELFYEPGKIVKREQIKFIGDTELFA